MVHCVDVCSNNESTRSYRDSIVWEACTGYLGSTKSMDGAAKEVGVSSC